MNRSIGENIIKYRKINGISQKYLAKRIGISSQSLLKIEKGIVSPRAMTLEKIMSALYVTPNQIFGVEEITEENSNIVEKLKQLYKGEGQDHGKF